MTPEALKRANELTAEIKTLENRAKNIEMKQAEFDRKGPENITILWAGVNILDKEDAEFMQVVLAVAAGRVKSRLQNLKQKLESL